MSTAPLSAAEQRRLKQQLTLQLQQLRRQMPPQGVATADSLVPAEVHDTKDEALRLELAESDAAAELRTHEEMQATAAALQRIVAGTFGICTECGRDIAVQRLRTQPSAPRCRPCQALRERSTGAKRQLA
jgi:RNA polymerase-binding transcription factor DksA